jgi:hypothetical protein
MVAGTAGLRYDLPIGFVILALLVIVTFSYRQMIFAYPSGGGSYIVSKEPSRRIPLWSVGFAALAIAEWRISRVSPRWVQILFHSSWPGGLGIDSPVQNTQHICQLLKAAPIGRCLCVGQRLSLRAKVTLHDYVKMAVHTKFLLDPLLT